MSDNVQLAQELVDARAAVASAEYAERAQRIVEIEAEAAQLKQINAAADARLQRAAVAVADIGNAEAYAAGYAAALAAIAAIETAPEAEVEVQPELPLEAEAPAAEVSTEVVAVIDSPQPEEAFEYPVEGIDWSEVVAQPEDEASDAEFVGL